VFYTFVSSADDNFAWTLMHGHHIMMCKFLQFP